MELIELDVSGQEIFDVAFSFDGELIASANVNCVKVWTRQNHGRIDSDVAGASEVQPP